jgi:hypothetical protein
MPPFLMISDDEFTTSSMIDYSIMIAIERYLFIKYFFVAIITCIET